MIDNYMIGVMILLISVFLSRFLLQNANKTLTQEKKAELIDLFSKDGMLNFGIIIGILGLYFLSLKMNWLNPKLTFIIFITFLIAFISIQNVKAYKKLKNNSYSIEYRKKYLLSVSIRFLGVIIFATLMITSKI